MRYFLMCLVFAPIAFGAEVGKGISWTPTPQRIEVAQGKVDIVLSDPLPQHWALTVISLEKGDAKVSAGSVDLDGIFVERVNNLDLRRLVVKPGVVRVIGTPNEAGLAVCVTVPAGTQVRVLHDDLLVGGSGNGIVVLDGTVGGHNPKLCTSVPLLQRAFSSN